MVDDHPNPIIMPSPHYLRVKEFMQKVGQDTPEGAIIPDGSDVQVSYRRQGDEDIVCDTLRSVRQVRPGEYVCDWIYWDGMRPLRSAPELREEAGAA